MMLLQLLAVNLKTYYSWIEWVDCLGSTVEFAEGHVSGISDGLSICALAWSLYRTDEVSLE